MITKEQASAIAEAGHEMVRRRGAHVMRWERGNPEALSIPAWDAIGPSKQEEYAAAIFRYNATGEIEWIPDPLKSGASVHIAQAPEARWPLDSFKVGADQKIIELGLTAEFPQRTATTDGATAALAITELAAVVESYALAAGCDCGSGASPLSRIRSSVALMAARILEVAPPSSPDGRMVSLGQRAWRELLTMPQPNVHSGQEVGQAGGGRVAAALRAAGLVEVPYMRNDGDEWLEILWAAEARGIRWHYRKRVARPMQS